ncbi:hypothetical protein L836_1265 [Mycobacteroides abscessus MAB_110811_2726]|nr:hypothetical protein L836_1265 [Mycobacteroides abscessus MAB_110811_2726]
MWGLLNVLLERTRYDPGNLGYEIFRDAGDLGHFLIQQTWKTPQLAERHLRSAAVSWCITRIQEAAHIPLRLTVCDVHRGHSKPAPPPLRSPLSTPAGVWAPSRAPRVELHRPRAHPNVYRLGVPVAGDSVPAMTTGRPGPPAGAGGAADRCARCASAGMHCLHGPGQPAAALSFRAPSITSAAAPQVGANGGS